MLLFSYNSTISTIITNLTHDFPPATPKMGLSQRRGAIDRARADCQLQRSWHGRDQSRPYVDSASFRHPWDFACAYKHGQGRVEAENIGACEKGGQYMFFGGSEYLVLAKVPSLSAAIQFQNAEAYIYMHQLVLSVRINLFPVNS